MTAATKCECGAPADDISFDRSICACGRMHYHCRQCGAQADGCDDAPEPAAASQRDICTTCGAMVGVEYHPYAFCVLFKAGLDPKQVVVEAALHYDRKGWPERMKVAREAQRKAATA